MPLPAQTFNTISELLNYINTFIVPNASQQINGKEHNNVENGLASFIVKYTLNSALATIVTSGGIVTLPTPVTVLSTPAPTAINWPDNVQNEYYIVNATGSDIPFTAGQTYVDQFGIAQTFIPAHNVIQIAKATNGSWVQVSNLPGTLVNADAQTLLGRYANTAGPLQEITIGSGLTLNSTTGVLDVSSASAPFNPIAGTNISLSGSYPNITFSVTDNSMAFTTGTTGTDINWQTSPVSLGGTARLNIPTASGAARGLLGPGDFANFNSKQSALIFSTGITNTAGTLTADLSTGKAGGQSVIGGTAASQSLTLSSTANGTKGTIIFGNSVYDENLNRLGIANVSPVSLVEITHNNLGNTVPDNGGLLLSNNTPGNSGVTIQNSPELRFRSSEWDLTDLISRTTDWRFYIQNNQGNSAASSNLMLDFSDNGGGYQNVITYNFHSGFSFVTFPGFLFAGFVNISQTLTLGTSNLSGTVVPNTIILASGNQYRIYNVFDNINDEYIDLGFLHVSNVFTISAGTIGGGTLRNIEITRPLGLSTNPVGTAYLTLAPGTTTITPLLFTSGTNNTTAQAGSMEYNGTNLFFTRTGTTREVVVTGNAGASAPSTAPTPAFTSYYGGNTNELGDPVSWLSFVDAGTTYKIPLYT